MSLILKVMIFYKENFIWATRVLIWKAWPLHKPYLKVLRLRYRGASPVPVSDVHDVCIDAFPRSANTFLINALQLASGGELAIAHHMHSPLQILAAVKYDIPAIVIVRPPLEAFVSLKIKMPGLSFRLMHCVYMQFYRDVLRQSESIVFINYSDVTSNISATVRQICRLIGKKKIKCRDISEQEVFQAIEKIKIDREGVARDVESDRFLLSIARPTKEKQEAKKGTLADLQKRYPSLLRESEELYNLLLEKCVII